MKNLKFKLSLFLNYFVFAILLNSVGTVIMQVINDYGVTHESAAQLEAYKDFSIAIFSFLIASYLPRFGYKKSMLASLAFLMVGCILMALFGGFGMSKLLFAMVGMSFGVIKISAWSSVSLITDNADEHASVMSTLEGIFMVGVLSSYWLFGFFIDWSTQTNLISWLDTYWVLALMSGLAFLLLLSTELDESGVKNENTTPRDDFLEMIGMVRFKLVLVFIFAAFLYVLIEQGIGNWLPTFNNEVLHMPDSVSVQVTSIFAAGIAIGRLVSGWIIKYLNWFQVLVGSMVGAMVVILLVLPITYGVQPDSSTGWLDAPWAAYLLPLIGLFLAPVYPTLSSSILSKMPKVRQSAMTGLIVIFSALGGTTGSVITGFIFGRVSGQVAFYFSLVPMLILLLILFPYKRMRAEFKFDLLTRDEKEEQQTLNP